MIEKGGAADAHSHLTFYGDQPLDYQTDVFANRALDFASRVDTGPQEPQQPFLLNLWFNSPHGPFDPAPRDMFRLSGTSLPKLPGFNEKDMRDKPKWLRKQAQNPLT